MAMWIPQDGTIQWYIWFEGGVHMFYFMEAEGMTRAANYQRVRRVHSLVVRPDQPPSGDPCGCGWGDPSPCPVDPATQQRVSYGYTKGMHIDDLRLGKWQNNAWHYYSWTPDRTKTDWPMDDPDQRAQCSDNPSGNDFRPDYVYANEISQYYEEYVSLQAYCNPERYPQQCSSSSCVKCYKFCAGCPWPYGGQLEKCYCEVDPETGECEEPDCSCTPR